MNSLKTPFWVKHGGAVRHESDDPCQIETCCPVSWKRHSILSWDKQYPNGKIGLLVAMQEISFRHQARKTIMPTNMFTKKGSLGTLGPEMERARASKCWRQLISSPQNPKQVQQPVLSLGALCLISSLSWAVGAFPDSRLQRKDPQLAGGQQVSFNPHKSPYTGATHHHLQAQGCAKGF